MAYLLEISVKFIIIQTSYSKYAILAPNFTVDTYMNMYWYGKPLWVSEASSYSDSLDFENLVFSVEFVYPYTWVYWGIGQPTHARTKAEMFPASSCSSSLYQKSYHCHFSGAFL